MLYSSIIGWILIWSHASSSSWSILLTDESDEGGEVTADTKEEQELGVVWSWMEVGASQHCLRRRHGGCCVKYSPFFHIFSLCLYFLQSLYLNLILVLDPTFYLPQGLNLLKRASTLWKEAQQLESEGLQKIVSAVAGSEAGDFYRLLRGAVSHTPISSIPTPPKKCHPAPTTNVSKPHPQESEKVASEVSDPADSKTELAPGASSSAESQALEMAIPVHMITLCLQLGDIKRVYKCWVEGCTEGLSTSCAVICAHVCREHLGWGWHVPLVLKLS